MFKRLGLFGLFTAAVFSTLAVTPAPVQAATPAICVYQHANFEGWRICYKLNQTVRYVGNNANDQISSIWVQPGAMVTICEHAQFKGGCRTVVESESYVDDDWNDIISSLHVGQ